MITSEARSEVLERAKDLRKRFSEAELRQFFTERSHESLFAYVGEPVFWGRVNVPMHILVSRL